MAMIVMMVVVALVLMTLLQWGSLSRFLVLHTCDKIGHERGG